MSLFGCLYAQTRPLCANKSTLFIYRHTDTDRQTNSHTHTHTYVHTHTRTHICTRFCTHICMHTHTRTLKPARKHGHTRTHIARSRTCARAGGGARAPPHALPSPSPFHHLSLPPSLLARSLACSLARSLAHSRAHSQPLSLPPSLALSLAHALPFPPPHSISPVPLFLSPSLTFARGKGLTPTPSGGCVFCQKKIFMSHI